MLTRYSPENPNSTCRMASMIRSPVQLATALAERGPKSFSKNTEMQMIRAVIGKQDQFRQYDVYNLNRLFGLPTEINQELLADAKALNDSITHAHSL